MAPTCTESDTKSDLNQNLSGYEVNYAACSFPEIFKNSWSKLDWQEGFNLIAFSYQVHRQSRARQGEWAAGIEAIRQERGGGPSRWLIKTRRAIQHFSRRFVLAFLLLLRFIVNEF